jgi:hypothetical protein
MSGCVSQSALLSYGPHAPDRPFFDPHVSGDDLSSALIFGRAGERLPVRADLFALLS